MGVRTAGRLVPAGSARHGFADPGEWLRNTGFLIRVHYESDDFRPPAAHTLEDGFRVPAGEVRPYITTYITILLQLIFQPTLQLILQLPFL